MNDLVNTALQAFGLKAVAPTRLDVKLLTDEIGRTLPMSGQSAAQYVGTANAKWLGVGGNDLNQSGYSNHGTAFSVVSYICDVAATIPWHAYALDKTDNKAKRVPNHPLADLLYRPNPRQSWPELKRQLEGAYSVRGEVYLRLVRPLAGTRKGKTAELWGLVGAVEPLPLTGLGEFDSPTGYRHTDALTGRITDYPAEEILPILTWNPTNPHRGLSAVQAGIDAVTAAKSGLESRVRQYQNQGPPGIIYDESEAKWTTEQAGGVQRWFDSFLPGRKRQGNVPVISGKLGYLKLGLSPVDMDVLAAIPYDKDAICDLWHFPGQLLNGSRGTTFSNMGEAGTALYNRCVLPLETVIRDKLNARLGAEYDDDVYLDFETSHIPELQEDLKDLVTTLKECYWMTSQEKQRRMNLEVDETLPKYLIPMGMQTLEEFTAVPPVPDDAASGGAVN